MAPILNTWIDHELKPRFTDLELVLESLISTDILSLQPLKLSQIVYPRYWLANQTANVLNC